MRLPWVFHPQLPGYQFGEILGQGGFGVVKLARQLATGRNVAVKIVGRPHLLARWHWRGAAQEARLMRSLVHEHIVQLLDEKQKGSFTFLVMELASRGTLHHYLVQKHGLEESEARPLFAQILSAVEYCHANRVAHMDLKPSNILLDSNMNVKLADFGLSRRVAEGKHLRGPCGTREYCAPEVLSMQLYDPFQADMWSLGVTLFAMLTATLPFQGKNAVELQQRIQSGSYVLPRRYSRALKALLSSLLRVEAWARYTAEVARAHWWFGPSCGVCPENSATLVEVLNVPLDPEARRYLAELDLLPGIEKERMPHPVPWHPALQRPLFLTDAWYHLKKSGLPWVLTSSDHVFFSCCSSVTTQSRGISRQLQKEKRFLPTASHKVTCETPKDRPEPEVSAARKPEEAGTPAPAKERAQSGRGFCRRILRFLQRACCLGQTPATGPRLRSRKVAPEGGLPGR
ncbi:uncharacterized protein LOC101525509 [Ochotona princeps]|uniref:uncharacterized protein LOC101525509 n=1 Tax=Ochotona princeps TaxID=9978 RepID=UPI002715313D|nr:uncharacterized protein LOC101525509 [Ochotona princeps]